MSKQQFMAVHISDFDNRIYMKSAHTYTWTENQFYTYTQASWLGKLFGSVSLIDGISALFIYHLMPKPSM